MIQMEMMDATGRGIGLNAEAVLDLDWKVADLNGTVIASGRLNQPMLGGNAANLGEYAPRQGLRQKLALNLHRDFEEPTGAKVTLEVNSTEDPEGAAFAFPMFAEWAAIVGGPGALLLLMMLILRFARPAVRETASRTLETP
jgi:hypothetical protein